MKTYKNLYEKCLEEETIRQAIHNAAKRKTKKPFVQRVLKNEDYYVKRIKTILEKQAYKPRLPGSDVITEGTRRKERTIHKVGFFDQCVQHVVVLAIEKVLKTGMYEFSCGSVPGRGPHYGKKRIRRWITRDYKGTKYCCQMDIKKFYPSIDQTVLKNKLSRKIKDDRMLKLLFDIIDSCENGLPLGFYTSQWLANFLLQDLDHYIKEKLKVKYYVRYLDDLIIFGPNKKQLHKARQAIAEYLEKELHLKMKEKYQVFRFIYEKAGKIRGRALDFMGFRFFREKITLRKCLMLKISRKARRIAKKPRPTYRDAAAMLSYIGWVKNTNTYGFYTIWIKPYIDVKQLKEIVSKHQRKENKRNEAKLAPC